MHIKKIQVSIYIILTSRTTSEQCIPKYCPFSSWHNKYLVALDQWTMINIDPNEMPHHILDTQSDQLIPSSVINSSNDDQVLLLQKKEVLLYKEMSVVLKQLAVLRMHFWRKLPMKSWRPMRANTLRQNTVRIMTSASFFTDWIRAPTMVFKPTWEIYASLRHIQQMNQFTVSFKQGITDSYRRK